MGLPENDSERNISREEDMSDKKQAYLHILTYTIGTTFQNLSYEDPIQMKVITNFSESLLNNMGTDAGGYFRKTIEEILRLYKPNNNENGDFKKEYNNSVINIIKGAVNQIKGIKTKQTSFNHHIPLPELHEYKRGLDQKDSQTNNLLIDTYIGLAETVYPLNMDSSMENNLNKSIKTLKEYKTLISS